MKNESDVEGGEFMKRRVVDKEAVKRAVVRSAKASAELERRTVPAGFIRSERVERFLADRRQRG
jgi:hypothetical protein